MYTIWKYPFEVKNSDNCPAFFKLEMTKGAEILSVQTQKNVPCIWAAVTPGKRIENRKFFVFRTGQLFEGNTAKLKFIGTFQLLNGTYVGHLFEEVGIISLLLN